MINQNNVTESKLSYKFGANDCLDNHILAQGVTQNHSTEADTTLATHHKADFQASGIPDSFLGSVKSICGQDVISALNLANLPDWQIKSYQGVIKHGGWFVESANWEKIGRFTHLVEHYNQISFKPDKPRQNGSKTIKYESPVGKPVKPFYWQVPEEIAQTIATKYGVHKPTEIEFWVWVNQHPQIPVAIVEGVKKAASLMANLFVPTIALTGHRNAYADKGDVSFLPFVHPNRKIYLTLDCDVKQSTRHEVDITIAGVIKRLCKDKANKFLLVPRCDLKIVHWNTPDKGIDDLICNSEISEIRTIFNQAILAKDWISTASYCLGYKPNITFTSAKFLNIELPSETILNCIIGAKGSGKTWYLTQLVKKAVAEGRPVISIVHRIQLAIANAARLGLQYIGDLEEKVPDATSVSLVVNSLWKIDPQKFGGGLILIDEVVSTIQDLMISSTCKSKRYKILKTLKELAKVIIETGGQFVIADADLNARTIRYFIGLLGDDIAPYIIQNLYRAKGYKCYLSNGWTSEKCKKPTPADIVATALSEAHAGKKIIIHCSGQVEKSKWGTICLEELFRFYGFGSVLRIDSETTAQSDHPAFRATSKIHELCNQYQIIIASPTLNTGVSIENEYLNSKFDLVLGIFHGVGNANSARQTLMRLRDIEVPRLIWVAERGTSSPEFSRYGQTQESVENRSAQLNDDIQKLLTKENELWKKDYPEIQAQHLPKTYFNDLIAHENAEVADYKKLVNFGLKHIENNEVVELTNASEIFELTFNPDDIIKDLKRISEMCLEDKAELLIAKNPHELSDEEYTKLKNQACHTRDEQLTIESKVLSKRYGDIEVDDNLIKLDRDGFYAKSRLYYSLTTGKKIVKSLSVLKGHKLLKHSEGQIIRHDSNESFLPTLKVDFIQQSGLLDLVGKDSFSKVDTEAQKVYQYLVENKVQFNSLFGNSLDKVLIPETFNQKPISFLASECGLDVVKLKQVKVKNTKINPYRISISESTQPLVARIFDSWLLRDTERAKEWEQTIKNWEIERLVSLCPADVDLKYFTEFQQSELFNEAWEHVNTDTRIQIINRADNYQLPIPTNHQINPDSRDYQAILDEIAKWDIVSLDLETYGNDPKRKEGLHARKGFIRLIQISNGYKVFYADLGGRDDNRELIGSKLQAFISLLKQKVADKNTKIIGQNIHFDLRFLKFQLDFPRAKNVIDTMLGAKIFFGNYGALKKPTTLPGGYGLGNLGAKFLGLKVNKDAQKSDWGTPLTQSQIDYAVYDPFITYWLYKRELEIYENPCKFGFGKLAQDGLMEAWQLENDIIPCAVELENNGLPFDKQLADNNLVNCKKVQTKLLKDWALLIPKIKNNQILFWLYQYLLNICEIPDELPFDKKLKNNIENLFIDWMSLFNPAFQYTQNKALKVHLNAKYSLDIKKLDKTALADLAEYTEVKLLGKLRAIKIPIQQLESLLRSAEKTGRVQTVFNTLTGTGRFSSGNSKIFNDLPNLQSISAKSNPALEEYKLPGVRTCVAVKDDRGFGVIDLSASHGRIAADVAEDETAIAGCNDSSIDNHSKVAVYIAKALKQDITWEEIAANKKKNPFKLYRDAAKNTYYGWLNCAGAKRVQEQIKANSGQIVSIEACQASIKGCEALYPNVVNFRKKLIEELSTKANLLHIDGKYYAVNKIKSVNNRITHLVKVDDETVDLPYTECLAAIWSRTEATALKRALIKIVDLSDEKPEWELKAINYVHDEINVEFNLEYAEIVLTTINNIIGDCFAETLSKVSDGREIDWKKLQVNNWSEK